MHHNSLFDLLLTLWPGDWRKQLSNLNKEILMLADKRKSNKKKSRTTKFVTEHEFWAFIGIIISAAATGKEGKGIYDSTSKRLSDGKRLVSQCIDYFIFMPQKRFEVLKPLFHYAFVDKSISDASKESYDPYFPIISLINDFNANRRRTIAASATKVLDESMSAFRPRTDKTGGLPNISFIARKPEPLGIEFKDVACSKTGILLHLKLQRGKT